MARIMTSYIQIVTSTASFNLAYPTALLSFLFPIKTVGESAKVFLSLDCFLIDIGLVQPEDTTEYIKALWTTSLPVLLTLLVCFSWFCLHFIQALNLSWKHCFDNAVLSIIVSIFIIHPSVTNMAMGLFNCALHQRVSVCH